MPLEKDTGKAPGGQSCPRCGRSVAAWWTGRFVEYARHKVNGRWCREVRAPLIDVAGRAGERGDR